MPGVGNFPDIAPTQVQTVSIDFGRFLRGGIIFSGSPVAQFTVGFGSDPDPQSHVISGPAIVTIPTTEGGSGVANAGIAVQLSGCLNGVTYLLEVYCPTSDGDVAEGWGTIHCVGPHL